jgi:hypothetical protein
MAREPFGRTGSCTSTCRFPSGPSSTSRPRCTSVDAARVYAHKPGFPAARTGFARNLWLREDVLSASRGPPGSEPRPLPRCSGLGRQPRTTAPHAVLAKGEPVSPEMGDTQ